MTLNNLMMHGKDIEDIFSINDLKLMQGELPKRVTSLVLEWAFYP